MKENELNNEEDLARIAPILNTIKKQGLDVPEAYFSEFPEKIMKKINDDHRVININRKKIILKWSIAASILLFIGIGMYLASYNIQPIQNIEANQVDNISVEEIYLEEIDEEDIIEFANDDTKKINIDSLQNLHEEFDENDLIELYN